jgi:hypothetical protein
MWAVNWLGSPLAAARWTLVALDAEIRSTIGSVIKISRLPFISFLLFLIEEVFRFGWRDL